MACFKAIRSTLSIRKHHVTRFVGFIFLVVVLVTVCVYYGGVYTTGGVIDAPSATSAALSGRQLAAVKIRRDSSDGDGRGGKFANVDKEVWIDSNGQIRADTCPVENEARTTIDTTETFSKFEFQPLWLSRKEYWDESFEENYQQGKNHEYQFPLKVIIVPHSHNDPGWLKTFEGYYHAQTKNILNHMADKLPSLQNMTFIWSEISFLSLWWDTAHLTKKRLVQKMLEEGRLEIVTGGWVMTDEATSHIYAMLDQLIEGHQWIKNNLGVRVRTAWSVDPFGHGSTVPYLLKSSGVLGGAVIQRIHYSWKQWFAKQRSGDFVWRQNWDANGRTDMLVHNQPFDMYTVQHSCGPHIQVCAAYDFRNVPGTYNVREVVPIDERNVKYKADILMEQYKRAGSLLPHNVVLVPLGDDFRYDHDIEWDQQYYNYKRLIDYINGRKETYQAEVTFGTPNDYFEAVRNRTNTFPTLKGDFFVYGDIFNEGRPAYWSGYFTTRPHWKLLDRELERNLRSAEILYTFGLNNARQRRTASRSGHNDTVKMLELNYEKLVAARRHLALFQHHDGITGTSKAYVMRDYALKLIEGIQNAVYLQTFVVEHLLFKNTNVAAPPPLSASRIVVAETDFESYATIPPKVTVSVQYNRPRKVVVFNSLAQHRQEVLKVQVNTPYVRVLDANGMAVVYQVNPVWDMSSVNDRNTQSDTTIDIVTDRFELLFVADLQPLSLNVFTIASDDATNAAAAVATVYCHRCNHAQIVFPLRTVQQGDIQLENKKLRALFDGQSGFLKTITKKDTERKTFCEMNVAAYQSAQFHSGAYLFMPDPNSRDTERDVLHGLQRFTIITSGPVSSEVTVVRGALLAHTSRLYHVDGPLAEGIYIENIVDFGVPPKNRETEMFMRFSSAINNGDPSVFYTDSNGMQMQKRIIVERIGVEGNYYPITTGAYIEDDQQRLTLLVDHSQGGTSWQPGWLEVMLDRRTLYDDARGMGEGLVDNKKILTKYWLLLEDVERGSSASNAKTVSKPSLLSNYLSNGLLYAPNLFIVEDSLTDTLAPSQLEQTQSTPPVVRFMTKTLPCDVHLLNFRTLSDDAFAQFPSRSSLMILQRQGFACDVSTKLTIPNCYLESNANRPHSAFRRGTKFNHVEVRYVSKMSLTGIYTENDFRSLDEITLQPMDLVTLNVTFGS